MFTGNRGCLVDESGEVVRQYRGDLWITCLTEFRGLRNPLARPGRWTPIFFLDEAVALAAGHRPCGYCRLGAYHAYCEAVGRAQGNTRVPSAPEINRLLKAERYRPGRGLVRAADRILWDAAIESLPTGSVIIGRGGEPRLVLADRMMAFSFAGWVDPVDRPRKGTVQVLTPPTSIAALTHGYVPSLHPSAS
jgi:hypothetical protein